MTSHLRFLVTLSFAGALAAPALAHVGLEVPDAARGKSYKAVLKVPHGCDGSPTHTVRVEIPEGFIGAKPMPKAGWQVKTVRGAYARSYGYYHGPMSEGVKEIEWSGGSLPDDYYDEFVAAGYVAKEIDADALYFKVVQVCDKGELAWNEIPQGGADPHSLKAPAAVLRIAAAGDDHGGHDHHGHGAADSAATPGTATIGALKIEGGWTRATAEGAKVGAGYLTISNSGSTADTLVSVETQIAGKNEIHEMTMSEEGVMRMRRLADGIEIPAGGSVAFKPGGAHLMFLDLKEPIKEGASVTVKLVFKSGAAGEVSLPAKALGGGNDGHEGPDGSGHDDHGHDGHGDHEHSHH
jgi:uncharacterized protein YcnI/copper(I)-binding protein